MVGVETTRPGVSAGPSSLRGGGGAEAYAASGLSIAPYCRRVLTDSQQRRIIGDAAERLPEQGVGHDGHRLAAAQALAVKRADHVVGEPGRVEVAWHGIEGWWFYGSATRGAGDPGQQRDEHRAHEHRQPEVGEDRE